MSESEASDRENLLRISYVVTEEEWRRLCEAHFTPISVMDLLNIYPREMQIQQVPRAAPEEDLS